MGMGGQRAPIYHCGVYVVSSLNLLNKGLAEWVNATAEIIYDLVDPGANLIFGAVIDPSVGSIALIATGFKRQEDGESRPLQPSQQAQGDAAFRMNRWPSFSKGTAVEIPEFLRKKGRSRYLRV
ncbi:Cell division protein FtsZ [Ancistrocladus abbreviatus]